MQRARQISQDAGLLLWMVLWGVAGWLVYRLINAVAAPARSLLRMASEQEQSFGGYADRVAKAPGVGDIARQPLDQMVRVFDQVGNFATDQVRLIEQLAIVGGILVFLIPVAVMIYRWLPARVNFARSSAAAQRFVDSAEDLDLFALRAIASAPMTQLAKISADPVGDWRRGDQVVIGKLADLELRREGLAWDQSKDHRN